MLLLCNIIDHMHGNFVYNPEKNCTKSQVGSLDESLHNITKLESAAEGRGKNTIASKEQNEGKEKLQVGGVPAELPN